MMLASIPSCASALDSARPRISLSQLSGAIGQQAAAPSDAHSLQGVLQSAQEQTALFRMASHPACERMLDRFGADTVVDWLNESCVLVGVSADCPPMFPPDYCNSITRTAWLVATTVAPAEVIIRLGVDTDPALQRPAWSDVVRQCLEATAPVRIDQDTGSVGMRLLLQCSEFLSDGHSALERHTFGARYVFAVC